ncbi:MAG: deoxyribonuclease IV [Deltaproteobacteria bacterium]|nr:deoxyribonuclease IV [Deltaproteobacteria bacterium]
MPLGVHTSIAGGLSKAIDRALELGCDCVQMFARNPRSWVYRPLDPAEAALFRKRKKETGIYPVAVHTNYLVNLCTPDSVNFDKSLFLFKKELSTAEEIGADYLVTHLGSPMDMGSEFAITRVLSAFRDFAGDGLGKKTTVLLENTSGAGSAFGSGLKDISRIIEGAKALGLDIGLCFDTCHAFAAGYALKAGGAKALLSVIDKEIGLERLKLIHLNDSKGRFSSRLDRHEHIGKGQIGLEAFRELLTRPEIIRVPMILETPKKTAEDDPRNLKTVRKILSNIA